MPIHGDDQTENESLLMTRPTTELSKNLQIHSVAWNMDWYSFPPVSGYLPPPTALSATYRGHEKYEILMLTFHHEKMKNHQQSVVFVVQACSVKHQNVLPLMQ